MMMLIPTAPCAPGTYAEQRTEAGKVAAWGKKTGNL
jgi:hypothetical protein